MGVLTFLYIILGQDTACTVLLPNNRSSMTWQHTFVKIVGSEDEALRGHGRQTPFSVVVVDLWSCGKAQ